MNHFRWSCEGKNSLAHGTLVALVACIHKLLTILNTMLRNNEKWNESYHHVAL